MRNIRTELSATVFKTKAAVGQNVIQGDEILVLESMKMEIPVLSDCAGKIVELLVNEGDFVEEGSVVARILQ